MEMSNVVAMSNIWLLSTWNVAGATEELNFISFEWIEM